MLNQWLVLGGIVVSAIGAYFTARFAWHAQAQKAQTEKEVGAGQLALEIANGLRGEITTIKTEQAASKSEHTTFRSQVRAAWRLHTAWDEALLDKVEELDPGASLRMPERPVLPLE